MTGKITHDVPRVTRAADRWPPPGARPTVGWSSTRRKGTGDAGVGGAVDRDRGRRPAGSGGARAPRRERPGVRRRAGRGARRAPRRPLPAGRGPDLAPRAVLAA